MRRFLIVTSVILAICTAATLVGMTFGGRPTVWEQMIFLAVLLESNLTIIGIVRHGTNGQA